MLSVTTDNCESGIPGMDEPHNHSLRWHAHIDGRTYIVYADDLACATELMERHVKAHENLTGKSVSSFVVDPSGYYCQHANAIYQAKDGPTFSLDNSDGRLT
jgi:hypothetical protein